MTSWLTWARHMKLSQVGHGAEGPHESFNIGGGVEYWRILFD
jgi:hypothetical protein